MERQPAIFVLDDLDRILAKQNVRPASRALTSLNVSRSNPSSQLLLFLQLLLSIYKQDEHPGDSANIAAICSEHIRGLIEESRRHDYHVMMIASGYAMLEGKGNF